MSKRKKGPGWFWCMLLIFFLFLLACKFEPLKTINEMYSAPLYLLILVFFISGAVWFTLSFREGKVIRREIIAKRKDRGQEEGEV